MNELYDGSKNYEKIRDEIKSIENSIVGVIGAKLSEEKSEEK